MKNIVITSLMIFLFSEISFAFGEQGDWRWRNDDGDVYSATWKDSLNVALVISSDYEENIRLRVKFAHYTIPGNIYLRYSDRPGDNPWIQVNNMDTGKFFISQSSYITDTMSYFDNQLLPPVSGYPYSRTITFDSSYNYNLINDDNSAYEMEYSLKTKPNLEPGKAYFFSLFSNSGEISLTYLKDYPVLMISPLNWNIQNSGTSENLTGISFVGVNNGWIVGGNGTILKTSDGGNKWILQPNVTSENLSDVFFIDENNGWIVGGNGTMLHTTDQGDNWTLQLSGTVNFLTSVYFISSTNGWAVGMDNNYFCTILKTTDGGNNWITQLGGTDYGSLNDVAFTDANNGIAVGGSNHAWGQLGHIYRTTDGGETWTYSEVYVYLNSVSFGDANNGIVVGGDYLFNVGGETTAMYRTTNGGETWTYQTPVTSQPLLDVYFIDTDNGWAVGEGGTILRTNDGGATWDFQSSGTIRDLNAVSFADANNGLVVGNLGKIFRTTNGGIPVELMSFTVVSHGSNALLNWSTVIEINNQGFEVQRSSVNSDYTRIGFVEGNGSTTDGHTYSYTDNNLNNGKYYYRLKQLDFDGSYRYSDVAEVTVNASIEFNLQQNYPNPFNPVTTIKYSIPEKSYVTLRIYDILGSEIRTLIKEEKPAGNYEFNLNAVNLSSGVYFYQLRAGSFIDTKKMILLK